MPEQTDKVEGGSKASFNELVAEKRKAGLNRDQAESVAKRQLERDAKEAKQTKKGEK